MPTTCQISASPSPGIAGNRITLTVIVTTDGDPAVLQNGTVTLFRSGGLSVPMTYQGVVGESATFTADITRNIGTESFTATYAPPGGGSESPDASFSPTLPVTWGPVTVIIALFVAPNPATMPGQEQSATVNFSVRANGSDGYEPGENGSVNVEVSGIGNCTLNYDYWDGSFAWYKGSTVLNAMTYACQASFLDENVMNEGVMSNTVNLVVNPSP